MHWWQNLRTLWPGALRQQVTRTGLAYSGAIVIVALAAVLSANNLLFLILAAMLSILAVSGFVSKLTLAGLEIDLLLPPHISARRKFRATVRLKNLKRWMPSFSIHVTGASRRQAPQRLRRRSLLPRHPRRHRARRAHRPPLPHPRPLQRAHLPTHHPLPLRFRRTPRTRHPAPRSHRLSVPRTAPPLPGPRRRPSRRTRSLAPRPRPRFLPHPPLRGSRKRPPRRLESHRPHPLAASPRIRPRRGSDDRHLPRPRRHPRSRSLV